MTSKKSSLNPFRFTYFRNLKGKWPIGVSIFILVSIVFWGVFECIYSYNAALKDPKMGWGLELKTRYDYVFNLGSMDSNIDFFFFEVLMLMLVGILAIILFRYLLSKSATNVIFSLGISRTGYFTAKYLAGVTIIAAGVILPILISCIANVSFFGNCSALWISAGYLTLRIIASMLWVFTAYVFTITFVGSLLETFVMGTVVCFSPYAINMIVSTFMTVSANGSPYSFYEGVLNYHGALTDMNGKFIEQKYSLFDFSSYIVPMTGSLDEEFLYLEKGHIYERPHFLFTFVFLAITVAIAAAAMFVCSKRHAEKAGFMGTSPLLQGYCVLTVGPALGVILSEIVRSSLISMRSLFLIFIVASVIIMVIGYTIVDFICIRSVKKYKARIKYLGIELAIFAVIAAAFTCYTNVKFSPVPRKEDVSSVTVSVPDSYLYSNMAYMAMVMYDEDDKTRIDEMLSVDSSDNMLIEDITSEDVIEKVIDMNKKLRKCSNADATDAFNMSNYGNRVVYSKVMITYNLKNGKKISRAYLRMPDEILVMICDDILSTPQARKAAANQVSTRYWDELPVLYISPNGSSVTPSEKFLSSDYSINPYKDYDRKEDIENEKIPQTELFEAIGKDIIDGTLPLNMKSDDELLGYICHSTWPDPDKVIGEYGSFTIDASALFPVYSSMKNTLAVLEKYGEKGLLENKADPVKITYTRYNEPLFYTDSECTAVAGGVKVDQIGENGEIVIINMDETGNTYRDELEMEMSDDTVTVSDTEKIAELEKAVQFRSLTRYGGYYARMDYEDGSAVFGFIPSYSMPK